MDCTDNDISVKVKAGTTLTPEARQFWVGDAVPWDRLNQVRVFLNRHIPHGQLQHRNESGLPLILRNTTLAGRKDAIDARILTHSVADPNKVFRGPTSRDLVAQIAHNTLCGLAADVFEVPP